jgi:alpha-tubulin suppressor-like RCC1 family protein
MLAGGLNCWGYNVNGELGDGRNIGSPQPVAHATLSSGIQRIEGQSNTKCALMTSGEVRCWGQNNTGQQATGDTVTTLSTRTMLLAASTPVTGVTDIAVGQRHSCVVAGGGAFCAGNNLNGALGNGTTTASSFLVPVNGLSSGVAKIAVVGISSTCAVLTDGTGRCWGNDGQGQLGNGMGSSSTTPVVVAGLTNAVDVVAGENFACARKQNQTVECWGHNSFGQLGNGNTALQQSPVAVSGLTDATEIVAGPRSVCALVANGAMRCWGWNFHGIFADGTTNNSSQPVAAQGLSGVTSVSKGLTSICVVIAGGAVKCWGSEQSGQLGNNRMENRTYSAHVVLATGLVRSSSLAPLTLLAPTTTVPATITAPIATTIPSNANASTNTSTVAAADENLRVDNKVYVVPPRSVGQLAMLRIVRSSNVRNISLSSVTPKICVAGGRSVVTIQSGDCRVLIRSLKTGTVLRQWKTTVVAADTSIGTTVRVAPAIVFPRASLRADRKTLNNALALVRGSQSAFVVGHSAFLTGKTPENRRLSHQRAAQIAQTFRTRTNIKQVVSIGVGGGAPVSSVLRESSQRKNRRVVVYYVP